MGGRLDALSHAARITLYVMAMSAHDTGTNDGPARTYWRGWPHLASAALGRGGHAYGRADEEAVRRAVAELADRGLVKRVGRRHGERQAPAMYELTL